MWSHKSFAVLNMLLTVIFFAACDDGKKSDTDIDTPVTDSAADADLLTDDIVTDDILAEGDPEPTDGDDIPAEGDAVTTDDIAADGDELLADGDELLTDDDVIVIPENVILVDLNATGANDGTSWTDAYTDLSTAITAAVSGKELWVAAGTYHATTCPMFACNGNDRKRHFTLKLGVALYGGFAGTETLRDERDWAVNETILSADLNDDDVWDDGAGTWSNREENAWHVVYITNDYFLDDTTILDGFTIKNGQADVGPTDNTAGGIRLGANNAPTIRNCTISGNYSSSGSAAISVEVSTGTVIDNCTFTGNFSAGSSAIGLRDSSVAISDTVFDGNYVTTGGFGGAISIDGTSTLTVTGGAFTDNHSTNGAALYFGAGATVTVTDSTFSQNGGEGTDPAEGVLVNNGGVLSVTGCSFTENNGTPIASSDAAADTDIVDTLFSQNSATEGGAITNKGVLTVTGCEFTGNTSTKTSGAIQNGAGGTMTVTDSLFDGNAAVTFGGAIANTPTSSATLVNCVFTGNSAAYGGAMANIKSDPTIINCTVSGNTATTASGIVDAESDAVIVNTIIRDALLNMPAGTYSGLTITDSHPVISYSDIAGSGGSSAWVASFGTDGGNNIDEDPDFVTAGDDPLALQSTSPCINTGSNAAVPAGVTTDLLGADRIQDVTVDMGAYEF